MASNPVAFKSPRPRPLGTGEAKRRMERTTARELAILTSSSDFKQWHASKTGQGLLHQIAAAIRSLSLSPFTCWLLAVSAAALGLLICLLYVPSDMQDQNGQEPALWGQSFASVDLAQKQVLANAVGWSPPGTMLAALSTFRAALQDARADNKILLQGNVQKAKDLASAKDSKDQAEKNSELLQLHYDQCSNHLIHMQSSADAADAEAIWMQRRVTALQAELQAVTAQKQELETVGDQMRDKLQKLEPVLPELSKVTSMAQDCQAEMNKLSGSQAKVRETIQVQQQSQQKLESSLEAAQQQLSLTAQDYAVCRDISSTLQMQHYTLKAISLFSIQDPCDMQAAHRQLIVGATAVVLLLGAGSLGYIRHMKRELGLATKKSQFRQRTQY